MDSRETLTALAADRITEAISLVIHADDEPLARRVVPVLHRARSLLLDTPARHTLDLRDRVHGERTR